MAKLTFIMEDDDGTRLETSAALPAGAIPRIYAAYAESYFPSGVEVTPASIGEDGEPIATVMRPPTGQDVIDATGVGLATGIINNVVTFEKAKAQEAAAAAVAPLTISPM